MTIFKMRANICAYFKNAGPLVSSAQNIDILRGSLRSAGGGESSTKMFKYNILTGEAVQYHHLPPIRVKELWRNNCDFLKKFHINPLASSDRCCCCVHEERLFRNSNNPTSFTVFCHWP